MALTLTFALKIAFLDFVAAGGIVSVSQTHLDILILVYSCFIATWATDNLQVYCTKVVKKTRGNDVIMHPQHIFFPIVF